MPKYEVNMEAYTIALFGEAEKGEYHSAYFCNQLDELLDTFGNAPENSKGIHYAIQALLYHRNILYFRVEEEGFSVQDYYYGVNLLKKQEEVPKLSAICMPGVGSGEIIQAMIPLCYIYHSILITTEADMYDYLTRCAA